MNHKKRTSSQSAILIAVIGAMLLVGLGIGYQIGINRSKQPATAATPAPLASPKQALPSSPAPENTPAKGLSPEQLAAQGTGPGEWVPARRCDNDQPTRGNPLGDAQAGAKRTAH